jgi:putative tryptophan/tyrosine transport system substrate-binding protein
MMRARIAIGLVLALARASGAAEVAILKSTDTPAWRPALDALRRVSPAHTFTEHDFRGERAEGTRILGELKDKGAILVALGPLAAQMAREALPAAPLVFCMVTDPDKMGLSPAAGLTGVAFRIPVRNQLAAFRMVNPRGVRIGVVHGPDAADIVAEGQKAAPLVRLALYAKALTSDQELPAALRALYSGPEAVDALWLPADSMLLGDETRRFLLSESTKAGKPVYAFSDSLVAEGALVSNGPDFTSIGELAGELVNRLATGERERIEMLVPRAELVINKKAASKLKIEIPADALSAANRTF